MANGTQDSQDGNGEPHSDRGQDDRQKKKRHDRALFEIGKGNGFSGNPSQVDRHERQDRARDSARTEHFSIRNEVCRNAVIPKLHVDCRHTHARDQHKQGSGHLQE